jgi:hypothetical protein
MIRSKLTGNSAVPEIGERLRVWWLLTGRAFPQGRRNHDLKYSFPEKAEWLYKKLIP